MSGRLIVFDDARAAQWMPFADTRPVGNLLFGAYTLASRAEVVLGLACAGFLSERLHGFDEPGTRPVLDRASSDPAIGTLYLSSRAVPDWTAAFEPSPEPALIRVGGETVGWWAPAGASPPPDAFFAQPADASPGAAREFDLPGRVLSHVWELITRNAEQILRDWVGTSKRNHHARTAERVRTGPRVEVSDAPLGPVMTGAPVHMIGPADVPCEIIGGDPNLVRVDPRNVAIEPFVLLDVSAGPIWLEQGVTIRSFTRLAGPAWIGRSTTLLGGSISGSSIGPHCKIRGEVEATVVHGFTNKAHDGFLGHAYVGRWVNLGALTTNSDLKNNYGTVRIWTPTGETDTGEKKIGCLLGDHVKTAIGTMFNTGTVVGAGANVFGAGMPPRRVSPFAWGDTGETWDVDRFLETAETAMGRRNVALTPGMREVLRRAWQAARKHAGSPA